MYKRQIANSYFAQFGLTAGSDYEYLNMDRAAAAQAILTGEGDVFVATDVDSVSYTHLDVYKRQKLGTNRAV